MGKMFVHYSGTVAAFLAANLEASYANKIVFISGDKAGKGAAIYTHNKYYGDLNELIADIQGINTAIGEMKYFSSVKVGDVNASAATKDSVLKIAANDPTTVEVNLGKDGINLGLTDAFKNDVANTKSGLASEIGRASGVEAALRQDLGTATDGADASGSAFARIAKLAADINAMTGGNGSIADQIKAAIELLDVAMVGGGENEYIASIKQEDGKIVATKGTLNFDAKGAAAAAETAAKNYADSLIAKDSVFEKRVAANESAISVLNGEGDGSVKKQVADAIAGVVASAPEDFDTLKEVADWIGSDTTGAAQMQSDIATLKGDDTVEGSVAKAVKDAKEEINDIIAENERVVAEALNDLDSRALALEAKNATIDSALQVADIDSGSANGTISFQGSDIAVTGLGSAAYTEASTYATAAQGALADAAAPQATTYTKTEVDAMWEWEEL